MNKNLKGFAQILILIILALVVVGALGYYSWQKGLIKITTTQEGSPAPTPDETSNNNPSKEMLEKKISLLRSDDLVRVSYGAAILFIPENKIEVRNGYVNFEYDVYGIYFTDKDMAKFNKEYDYGSDDLINGHSIDFNIPEWTSYAYGQNTGFLLKKGIGCFYTSGGPVCSAGDCGTPPPEYYSLSCAYLENSKKNTLEEVKPYVLDIINKVGIDCTMTDCTVRPIAKTIYKNGQNIKESTDWFSIPQYSKNIIFFEPLSEVINDEQLSQVSSEVTQASSEFLDAGWEVKTEDYTQTEKKWSSSTSSLTIHF